jgi:inner membrane protein
MASVFGHIAVSTALGYAFFPKQVRPAALLLAGFCAFAPDLDVLAFRFDIPYDSPWGHRGWTHSLMFAVILGALAGRLLAGRLASARPSMLWMTASTLSHPLLDMLTNGGRGCALWWPFSEDRIFFPFRPIAVSPLSIGDFISGWGLEVLASELIWVVFPAVLMTLAVRGLKTTS